MDEQPKHTTSDDTPNSGRLRDRLAELGDRLDRLVASPEIQEARQKVLHAVDDLEERLNSGDLSGRLEAGITGLGSRVRQAVDSPQGQEFRHRLATLLHDLAGSLERAGRGPDRSAGSPPPPPPPSAGSDRAD